MTEAGSRKGQAESARTPREFLTLDDVAKLLRVSKPTVRKAVQQQGLPALRLGERVWRFRRVDVEAWIESQAKGAA